MKPIIYLFLTITFVNNVIADDYKSDVIEAINGIKNNPSDYVSGYTDKPVEANINKDNLDYLAKNIASSDDVALALKSNFNNRPEYALSIEELSKSTKIIKNADDIVGGISNNYTDCKTIKNCIVKYDETIKHCQAANKPQTINCDKDRTVTVMYPDIIKKIIRVEMKAYNDEAAYTFDIKTKTLISGTTSLSYYQQTGDYDGVSCNNFTSRELTKGLLPGTWARKVDWKISFNGDCNNPTVSFYFDQRDSKKHGYQTKGGYIEIEIMSQELPIVNDNFESTCTEINKWQKTGYCRETKTICVDGQSTKIINGTEVARDCWRYRATYSCGMSEDNQLMDTCNKFENDNCIQVSSKCTNYLGDKCVAQEKGFKCPVTKCSDDSNIICGGTYIQCKDGSCVEKSEKEPSDFNDAATKIAAIGEGLKGAPRDYNEDSKFMFAGKAMECRKDGYGFSDCCKDEGWGQDMGLAHCSDDEKELGEKKEKLFTIYLGKKSHKNDAGIKKIDKVYCVFDSKLSKIIQEQGRLGQLGLSLGNAKNPNCSAISPKDLSNINFDMIDLSAAFEEANSKHNRIEQTETTKKLTSKIDNYYTNEVVNGA